MSLFDSSVQHPLGATVGRPIDILAYNRTGGSRVLGDVVQLDTSKSQVETTGVAEGESSSIYANFVIPVAVFSGAAIGGGGVYGVVQETIADNAKGKIRLRGLTQAYIIAASGTVAVGAPLVLATAYNCDLVPAAGEPYHAICTVVPSDTTPTSRTIGTVLFEGIGNFGTFVS